MVINVELAFTERSPPFLKKARSLQKELQVLKPVNILAIESSRQTEAIFKESHQKAIALEAEPIPL